jgi:predicted aspartyl protease
MRHFLVALFALASALIGSAAVAASSCKMVKVAEWPTRPGGGVPLVEGAINGKKIGIMLDTGSNTFLLRSSADRLGVTRQTARGPRVFGIGGETYIEAANIDEFSIGQIVQKNWRVMVAGEGSFGDRIDVILGEDFFDKFDVEFDLPHNAVRLFQPKDCEGVSLAYWTTQGVGAVDIEPSYNAGRQILLTVQVNGQPMQANLDSGSSTSVMDKSMAERIGITPDSPGVVLGGKYGGLGGKTVDFWVGPLRSFAIGDEAISDTTIRFADLWKDAKDTPIGSILPRKIDLTPALLLGADFLRAHRVLVAQSQHRLYFTYEGGPVFQPRRPGEPPRASPPAAAARPSAETK